MTDIEKMKRVLNELKIEYSEEGVSLVCCGDKRVRGIAFGPFEPGGIFWTGPGMELCFSEDGKFDKIIMWDMG